VWQEREALSIAAHGMAVHSVAFTPDGRRLVSASADGSLKLWDAAGGKLLLTLNGHGGAVRSVAVSPDGKRVYSCSADKTIKIWDAASGRLLQTLGGHGGEVNSLSLSGDGKLLCSASADGTIRVWDADTGRELRAIRGHTGAVNAAAMSGDGTMIFSGGKDKTLRLWDAASGKELNKFTEGDFEGEPLAVAFSSDSKTMAAVFDNRQLSTCKISEDHLYFFTFYYSPQTGAAFSPNGKFLLSCSEDGFINVWVRRGEDYKDKLVFTRLADITALAHDGQSGFCGSGDTSVKVWDMAAGRQTGLLQGHYKGVSSLALSPDGKTLLSGSKDQTIKLWNIADGKELKTLTGMRATVKFLHYSPDGKRVICYDEIDAYTAKDEKNVFVWDTESWEPKGIAFYRVDLYALLFAPGGKQILTSSPVGILKILDIETGEVRHNMELEKTAINVVFSPDGGKAVFAYSRYDGTIKQYTFYLTVHDAKTLLGGSTGGELWTAPLSNHEVNSAAFSPDGRQLLVSFYDNKSLKILDSATGKELASIATAGTVSNAAFSPDGKRIIAVLDRRSLGIWDRAGKELARFIGFSDGEWFCLTPQGYYAASPKGDACVRARLGGKTLGLEEYRARYRKPERVQALLAGGAS
jgi:WD40 repeat protein